MNWKIVECKLLLIIGIVVLACLETTNVRLGVIIVFLILFVALPVINRWYVIDEFNAKKKECEALKQDVDDMELVKSENKKLREENDELRKQYAEIQFKLNKCEKNIPSLFYNYILSKWAKENNAPFTSMHFDSIKEEFEDYYKNL